jgi:transposase
VPALHGDPRRRSGHGVDVQRGDRRPRRFRRSRDVAAYFGLTSKRWQSGASIDVQGRISKAGDPDVRRALYEAASAMLTRYKGKTALKSWGRALTR